MNTLLARGLGFLVREQAVDEHPVRARKKLQRLLYDCRVNAFNFAGLIELKLLSFVKDPAVEPVLAGVLVAPGGAYLFLFLHELL